MLGQRGNNIVIALMVIIIAVISFVLAAWGLLIFNSAGIKITHDIPYRAYIGIASLAFFILIVLLFIIWRIVYRLNSIRVLEKSVEERTAEFKSSEEKYRSLIDQASDAVYILNTDLNFTDVNESMCKMMGYSKDELLSLNVRDILNPEELINDPLPAMMIDTPKPIFRERTFIRKDGHAFPVEINVKLFPGRQVMVMARDISARKKMETELREAELKFRTLAEKSMVGIYIRQNDRFLYVNPRFAEIFGYEQDELLNMKESPIDIMINEDYREMVRPKSWEPYGGDTENTHFEIKAMKKDGSEIWVEFYGNRATINGSPAVMGTTMDITERKEAEHQVLREMILSDTLINSLPGSFYLFNEQGKYLRWNNFMESFTGYNSEEIEHLNAMDLVAPEDREKVGEAIEKVFREGYATIEAYSISKDGTRTPFIFTGAPILYEGQRCLLGVGIDISSRIRAEEEVRVSEQKYKLLFDASPMPLWMIDKETLNIIAVNDATANLYGYEKEELMNMNVLSVRSSEDRERQLAGYRRGESTGAIDLGIVQHLKKDGTPMFVHIMAHDIIFEGRPVRLSYTNDVTKRLQAEEAIKKSEANLRSILTASDNIYVLFDTSLHILDFNEKAAIFFNREFHHDVKKGDFIDKVISEKRLPVVLEYAQRVLVGERIRYEIDYPQPDGSVIWYNGCLSPISNDAGVILGMLVDLHDITEIKLNNQHLQNAYDRIQGHMDRIREMAWKQSHVIRSPLANVKGLAELLKIKPDDKQTLEYLQMELDRLDAIIHEMARDASGQDL